MSVKRNAAPGFIFITTGLYMQKDDPQRDYFFMSKPNCFSRYSFTAAASYLFFA